MRQEKSDEMFVKWSHDRDEKYWDSKFIADLTKSNNLKTGLDVGGGIGTFAKAICELNREIEFIDIVDPSTQAHQNFIGHPRTKLIKGTMDNIKNEEPYDFITINLVCHHILGKTERDTLDAQVNFLKNAFNLLNEDGFLVVEENIYDSYLHNDACGRIIYELTSLRGIDGLTRKLGANTAGEGVRFHSDTSWRAIFKDAGFELIDTFDFSSWDWKMPLWQAIPLLCKKRYQRLYVLRKDSSIGQASMLLS